MQILVINSEYPPIGGGAGNAAANIARGFAAHGHQVLVLTARFGGQPRLETQDGVSLLRVEALRRRQDRSNPLEQLAFIASAALHSPGVVRRFQPQVTLAFFGMPSGAVAWLIKKMYGIPYIVSLRGGDVPGFRPYDFRLYHKLIGPFLKVIWRAAYAVVANSQGLRGLANAFQPSIDIPVIPNGVDPARYTADPREWSPVRLFSVGRLVYQKGFDLGLRALAGLRELDWEWTIAGDGPAMSALQAQARDLGLQGRIRFLGWLARDELVKWYHQSNLFLFPSRHEGMPNAILEAMASGLPVVATRISGNEELVLDGVTGRLVEAGQPAALQAGLRELIGPEAEPLRRQMGAAARARVERDYSWESVARQYEAIQQDAVRTVAGRSVNQSSI